MSNELLIALGIFALVWVLTSVSRVFPKPIPPLRPKAKWLRGPDFVIDLDKVIQINISSGVGAPRQWVSVGILDGYRNIDCKSVENAEMLFFLLTNLLQYRSVCNINGPWGELEAM